MKSIFEYFKFKIDYLISCINIFLIKELVRDVDDKHHLMLTEEEICKLTEEYLENKNTCPDIEDFIFYRLRYV